MAQVEEQLRAKLRVEVLPERMRKALEFVRADAVTLHADGTASVQSGKQTYTLSPECTCGDAKHRTELCKHTLAVELHRHAVALVEGTAPAPASSATPTAPSPSQEAAARPLAALPSAPASHAWDVHEAPASACFKFRVGTMELLYTLRGIDDAELQRRMTATLPTLQEVIEACEARAAQRVAAREAAQAAQAQPAPQTPPAAFPQADLQTLMQQACSRPWRRRPTARRQGQRQTTSRRASARCTRCRWNRSTTSAAPSTATGWPTSSATATAAGTAAARRAPGQGASPAHHRGRVRDAADCTLREQSFLGALRRARPGGDRL